MHANACRALGAALVLLALAAPAAAQQPPYPSNFSPRLAERAAVRDALAWIDGNFPRQVEEWIRITEIPGTSRHEQARAAYVREQMEGAGLEVTTDSIGNVVGRRRGSGGGPTVALAAHLDTVHPLDTDVKVRREGDVLRAPGVFDNSASVANLLAVARALDQAGVRTRGDLLFIGTAQEELGLVGMAYWLDRNPRAADVVVAVDGGLGPVMYGALGIYWTRYTFRGEGSHTNTSAGKPHPVRALADAVRSIYELRLPEGGGNTVFNVGMVDGGKIFNAIPEEVSFTMDLRSVDPLLLDSLDAEITARVQRAAEAHRVRWEREVVTRNGAGGTEVMLRGRRAHPLVQTALDVHRFLGIDTEAVPSGSTDANAAVERGIPAISVGRSSGGDQHTLSEWSDVPSALKGTRMVLLLALSMAGVR